MGSSLRNPPSRFLKDLPQELIASRRPVKEQETELRYRGPSLSRLRGARSTITAQPTPTGTAYSAGDHVRHGRFGEGIVVSCVVTSTDQEVTVAFKGEAGVKKLLLSYAPLEKV